MAKSTIGLDVKKSEALAKKLNKLLADYQVFYMNVRGYHWNIKGDDFFTLHPKFEEYYDNLLLKIDEIAERILTLGFTPLHAYSDYSKESDIKEDKNVTDGKKAVQGVIDGFSKLIVLQRDILDASGEIGDEGTNSIMSDYITEQEKEIWMLKSYLG